MIPDYTTEEQAEKIVDELQDIQDINIDECPVHDSELECGFCRYCYIKAIGQIIEEREHHRKRAEAAELERDEVIAELKRVRVPKV